MKTWTGLLCIGILCCGCGGKDEPKKASPTLAASKHPPFKGVTLTEATFDQEVLKSPQPVLIEFWRDG
jgi:hypothetical protein